MKTNSISTVRQIFFMLIILCTCLLPSQIARAENSAPARNSTTAFMPFMTTPPRVSGYFVNTSNSCTGDYEGEAQSAPATLSFGFKRLGHEIFVQGGQGLTWRQEWSLSGNVAEGLTSTGTITEYTEPISGSIVYGVNGICGKSVPTGEWTVRFYLDGRLAQEAVIIIQ